MTDLDRLQVYANDLLMFNKIRGAGMTQLRLAIHNGAVEILQRTIVRGNSIPANMTKLCNDLITTDNTETFFDSVQATGYKPRIRHAIAVERLHAYCHRNDKPKKQPPRIVLTPPEPDDAPLPRPDKPKMAPPQG